VGGDKYPSSNTNPDASRGKNLFAKGGMSFGVVDCSGLLRKDGIVDEYFMSQSSPSPFL